MNRFVRIPILLIVVLSNSVLFAQTTSDKIISSVDTFAINVSQDSLAMDTALYRPIMLYRDCIRYNLNKACNGDVFKFKYDPFKEKMKEPWIGDILKEIFFR